MLISYFMSLFPATGQPQLLCLVTTEPRAELLIFHISLLFPFHPFGSVIATRSKELVVLQPLYHIIAKAPSDQHIAPHDMA